MKMTECINYLLSVSQNVVFRYFSQRLAVYDITPSQYGVLNCLWNDGPLTPSQIGAKLYLEASSVSGVLDRMQKSALIERSAVPENRRMVLVSPTKKAVDMREGVDQIVQDMNRHFLGHFLPDEQRRLKAFLRRVIDTSPND